MSKIIFNSVSHAGTSKIYNLIKGKIKLTHRYIHISNAEMNSKLIKMGQYPQDSNQLHSSSHNLHFHGQE